MRPLALSSDQRSPKVPDVPTVAESGLPGFDMVSWYGLWGPAKLPADITQRLAEALRVGLQSPEVRRRIEHEGAQPMHQSPEEFARFVQAEIVRWREVAQRIKLSLD